MEGKEEKNTEKLKDLGGQDIRHKRALSAKQRSHFKSWLSGFIDGEGCFSLATQTVGRGFSVHFTLRVRADELAIIEKIHRYLGGHYYLYYRPNSKSPLVNYVITGAKNCLRLVKHLEEYPLQAKKRESFDIWREAIYLLISKKHLKGRRDYLLLLRDNLRKSRQYSRDSEAILKARKRPSTQ